MSTVDLITKEVNNLSDEQQRRVLDFARSLTVPRVGVKLEDLQRHIGSLSATDAQEMRQAIEEDCERINAEGW